MSGLRNERNKKEATFLESGKDALGELRSDISNIKSLLVNMQTVSTYPSDAWEFQKHGCDVSSSWNDWYSWYSMGFDSDFPCETVSVRNSGYEAEPCPSPWESITPALEKPTCIAREHLLAYRTAGAVDTKVLEDLGEIKVAEQLDHKHWRPSSFDIFRNESASSLRKELEDEAAIIIQQFCRIRLNVPNKVPCSQLESSSHVHLKQAEAETTPELSVQSEVEEDAELIAAEPKRPPSAYFLYAAQRAKSLPRNLLGAANTMSVEWNRMAEEERRPWIKLANKLKAKYDVQMNQYRELGRGVVLHGEATSAIEKPSNASAGSDMKTLKPHVMKLVRGSYYFDEMFTETMVADFYDEYFSVARLQSSNEQDLEFLEGFLRALSTLRQIISSLTSEGNRQVAERLKVPSE